MFCPGVSCFVVKQDTGGTGHIFRRLTMFQDTPSIDRAPCAGHGDNKTHPPFTLQYLHYTALYIFIRDSPVCTDWHCTVNCTALYRHAQYTLVTVARKRTRQTPNQTTICRPKFASYTRENICFIQCNQHVRSPSCAILIPRVMVTISRPVSVS